MRDDIGVLAEVPIVSDDDDSEDMGAEGEHEEAPIESRTTKFGPIAKLTGLIAMVPPIILSGVSSGLIVSAIAVVLLSVLGGSGTAASAAGDHGTAASASAAHGAVATPVPTRSAVATKPSVSAKTDGTDAIPTGPTATPKPLIWQPSGTGWIGYGVQGSDRRILLMPDKLNRIDDRRENYTLTTRFSVLTASGEGAPLFAIALSYFDDTNFVILESYTQKRQPYMKLSWAKDGNGGPIGEPVQLPIPFWGRDTHELKVTKTTSSIQVSLNKEDLGEWPVLNYTPGGVKGMFIWFGSRMRFDSFVVTG